MAHAVISLQGRSVCNVQGSGSLCLMLFCCHYMPFYSAQASQGRFTGYILPASASNADADQDQKEDAEWKLSTARRRRERKKAQKLMAPQQLESGESSNNRALAEAGQSVPAGRLEEGRSFAAPKKLQQDFGSGLIPKLLLSLQIELPLLILLMTRWLFKVPIPKTPA